MGHPYLINILNNSQTGRTVQQTVFLSKTFLKNEKFTIYSIFHPAGTLSICSNGSSGRTFEMFLGMVPWPQITWTMGRTIFSTRVTTNVPPTSTWTGVPLHHPAPNLNFLYSSISASAAPGLPKPLASTME